MRSYSVSQRSTFPFVARPGEHAGAGEIVLSSLPERVRLPERDDRAPSSSARRTPSHRTPRRDGIGKRKTHGRFAFQVIY